MNSDAKHILQASITFFPPRMFRYVSCWPAKDASGRSSAVADDRTATSRSLVLYIFESLAYDVSISSRGIRFDLDYNDIITAKISHVDEVKNITIDDVRRLRKGIVIKVPPVKVPRILGRNNSMISLIKDKTGCDIVVGNNGLVWISFHGNVELAVESIGKVVKEAHIPGLTNRMEQYLNKKKVN